MENKMDNDTPEHLDIARINVTPSVQPCDANGNPLQPNGMIDDYPELVRRHKAHPILSRQEACAELLVLAAQERARGQALGLEGIAREANEREGALRRQQEIEGKERARLESAARAKMLADHDAAQATLVEASLCIDPETNEKVTALELVARNHARAMSAIQAKAAEPVHMTEDELQAAHQRKTELTARYNAARDESLRPVVAVEKF
jgi:hypothetical protein